MEDKYSTNPIPDMGTDWDGIDPSNGKEWSGASVQAFIKNQLRSKAGVFYYDASNNRFLVFADDNAKDEYLADPTKTELLIGTFDAPFNYSAEITLTSNVYNAVFLGSTGNYLDFTFDIKNKSGASTGENVTVTYTFIRNATKQVITETRKFGEAVHFNIDKYIAEGTNIIIVGVTGQTSLAATTASVTYQVVNLSLSDETNVAKVYNLSGGAVDMEVLWNVSGYGTKVVEWFLDGEQLEFDKSVDEVVASQGGSPKYITLSNLGQGRHNLQFRAYTTINGEKFYTDTLYRDIIVYDGSNKEPIFAFALTTPKEYGVVESAKVYDMIQYVPYTLRFGAYNPSSSEMNIDVKLAGETKASMVSENEAENEVQITSATTGTKELSLVSGNVTFSVEAVVKPTTMKIREITSNLLFDFQANGKTNNSTDKDSWSYGSYTGTFTGFNWNETSGWVDNKLRISKGSSFGVNYAPLGGNPTSLGRTIEMEFKTTNVFDDEAIVCDLRNTSGYGLVVKATKVELISAQGVSIVNEFKSDENVRFAFVINRTAGVTNKCLAFIYVNGTVSRCENFAVTDSWASTQNILFSGSADVEVILKQIRVYDYALSSDDLWNNFTLYRDKVEEMMSVYDRNDVYEEGTQTFSPDKMSNRLPVMIVTGDIPTLENTNDKDTQIIVDVEYRNMQDPSKSFTMKGAAMRPQGTSSMGYPKKNFRLYTRKVDGTVLYDANGRVVADKLYAFTDKAQPVDCWCMKADYAESSGVHNTGIARMWHNILMNTQIDGEYKLRTEAQKLAAANGYPYDVRTTIDGFPILMFYRKNANDDLIFIGKYNFNNDKSTESVFGFTFPEGAGMDEWVARYGSTMQCWEVLNNGNPLALFTDVSGFDSGWSEAFESRYPDTKTPNTSYLKAFSQWMNGVSQTDFATQKWEHMDVYKMAAYYSYLMRYGAVDQPVKNSMLTSEDGVHFYFILYDNDTINGLINTGRLKVAPNANRQTKDESGEYVFAGHDSVLWNRLEADEEFMSIVRTVDDAMFSAGLSYANSIHYFDELQADKWVERVYNQDAQYKYVSPFVESGTNNLFMLQGKRDIHRKWWLAKRFSLYDSLFVSGAYKSQSLEFKCINNTPQGQTFGVTAGETMYYGYGINDVPRESGVSLEAQESYDFVTKETVNLGDPIRVYAAPNLEGLDLSKMTDRLATIDITKVYDSSLGTRFKKLVIGNISANNQEVTTISGLPVAEKLEYLDVQGLKELKSLDLSNQPYFKTLKAKSSGVASIIFAKGAPVELIEYPASTNAITLEQLPYLKASGVVLESGYANVAQITVKGCPELSKDFSFVYDWYTSKTTVDAQCSLVMDNIDWSCTAAQLIAIGGVNKSLKGKVMLSTVPTEEELTQLVAIYGADSFKVGASFLIDAPEGVIFVGSPSFKSGNTEIYSLISFPVSGGAGYTLSLKDVSSTIEDGKVVYITDNVKFYPATGEMVTTESATDKSVTVRATHNTYPSLIFEDMVVTVEARTYPELVEITGEVQIMVAEQEYTYTAEYTPSEFDGTVDVEWSIDSSNVTIVGSNTDSCTIKAALVSDDILSETLVHTMTKLDGSVTTTTFDVIVSTAEIIMTKSSNPEVLAVCHAQGWAANEGYMTKAEAEAVTDIGTVFKYNKFITSFNEFEYFESVTTLSSNAFQNCEKLEQITFPNSIINYGGSIFGGTAIKHLRIPTNPTSIAFGAFNGGSLETVDIGLSTFEFSTTCFSGAASFREFIVDPLNPKYTVIKGALYSKDGKTLYTYPTGLKTLDIADGTEIVSAGSLEGNSMSLIDSYTIPSSVKTFHQFQHINAEHIIVHDKVLTLGNYYGGKSDNHRIIELTPNANLSFGGYGIVGKNVHSFVIKTDTIFNLNTSIFAFSSIKSGGCFIYVPDDSVDDFKAATNWIEYADYILPISSWKIITSESNPAVLSVLYANGLCANEGYMSYTEAAAVTDIGTIFQGNTEITSFDEFKYFTGVTELKINAFENCSSLREIIFPSSIQTINSSALSVGANGRIEKVDLSKSSSLTVTSSSFYGLRTNVLILPSNIIKTGSGSTMFGYGAFDNIVIYAETPLVMNANAFQSSTVGNIYVPDTSVDLYKSSDVWSTYASQIKPLSEYVEE